MRLYTVIIVMLFVGMISVGMNNYLFNLSTLENTSRTYCNAFYAKKFIAESFRNTCKGKGFSDLNEWCECCRALFNLDSISWNFVDNAESQNLLYGKWTGNASLQECSGEVYCRINSGELYEK